MDRRAFFSKLGLGIAALGVATTIARADGDCSERDQFGRPVCTAGLRSFTINSVAQRQYLSQWCWAACISSIFSYYGHPVSQARVVAEAYGQIVDMPGSPGAILGSLNRRWRDDLGNIFDVQADTFSANPATAIDDLYKNHPLLIGALGHATVLTALSYYPTQPLPTVVQAIVRDPWPGNPNRRLLTPQEWANVSLAARIRVY